MSYSVYWIHLSEHTNMFSQGYIGVSNNPKNRWHRHWKYNGNEHLKNAIKKYGWNALIKKIIVVGEKDYCFDLETKIRPNRQIGWNIAEGGAKPPTTQYRGDNYTSPLKGIKRPTPWNTGRIKTPEEIKKLSDSKKVKVKYQNVIYNSFEDLAKYLNIKYSTLTNRIYRNAKKYGYEVLI
jgi:hypothetical protein